MFDGNDIKQWFAKSLNTEGRINRTDHLLRKLFLVFLIVFITIIAALLINVVAKITGVPAKPGAGMAINLLFIITVLIYAYIIGILWNVVSVLRLHDLGVGGSLCILNFTIFIPLFLFFFRIKIPRPGEFPFSYVVPIAIFILFNVVLLILRGDDKENKYGPLPWEPQSHAPSEAEMLMSKAGSNNRYIAAYGAQNRKQKLKPVSSGGARKVDKKFIKHSDRYQPKSAKKR